MTNRLHEMVRNAESLVSQGYYGRGVRRTDGARLSGALRAHGRFPIIAEVKLASPSLGRLSVHSPQALISSYVQGGAAALSVLTEPNYFLGSTENMDLARGSGLPMLMKDIVVSDNQIAAAARHGASAVLLIQEVFDDILEAARRDELIDRAHELGLEVLLEATTADALQRARDSGADLLGINQRDLRTLTMDVGKAGALLPLLSDDPRPVVVLSGIDGRGAIEAVRDHGANAVLVGGHLSSSLDVKGALEAIGVDR